MSPAPEHAGFEARIRIVFLLAVLVVAGMSVTAWNVVHEAHAAALRLASAHELLSGLARTRAETLQVELSTQGFRLTGDLARLAERDRAMRRREEVMTRVRELIADDPVQGARWADLKAVIDQRIALSRQIEMLRKTEGEAAASAFVATAPLKQTRERIDVLLGDMDDEQRRQLRQRAAAQLRTRDALVGAGVAVVVLLCALLGATYVLIRQRLRNSEDHLRNVISRAPAIIAHVDARQHYVYANSQYLERFARGRSDVAGLSVREVLGEARYAVVAPLIERVLQGEPQDYDWEPFPGEWQFISYLPRFDERGQVTGYYVLGADITGRKRAEARIRQLNGELEQRVGELERVSRALRTLSAGNRAMLRATGEHDLLDSMCRELVDKGGYPMAAVWLSDAGGALVPTAQCGHPGGMDALIAASAAEAAPVLDALQTEDRIACFDQDCPPPPLDALGGGPVMACALRAGDQLIGMLAVRVPADGDGRDDRSLIRESADDLAYGVTSLRTREQMYRLTQYDTLTGLPNQMLFGELLTAELEDSQRMARPFALLQMNIERLSEINDALGFGQGDEMLKEFGRRLGEVAPPGASIARLRGDEFALLLPASGRAAALAMAQRLRAVLSQPFALAELPIEVSTRIGVALYPDHGSTPHDLFRHMDIAVRHAKKRGVDCMVFDPDRYQVPSHRLNMAGELRRAIEAGNLRLHLQPKVDMRSGRVCGAEALVRWQHPLRGPIPPAEFIPLAEQTGLIRPLTEWVLERALQLNAGWEAVGRALPIAVNLSARSLRDDDLVDRIRQMLGHWTTRSGLLEIEITESALMEDAEFALGVLNGLRAEGLRLYIDDFGTGYSSLSYLLKLPVDCIKIDQSFVRAMTGSSESAVIVRSTVDLAHDLGRKVVAEGVETRQHWDALAALGCDVAQGYLIARPMPAEQFQGWVEDFRSPEPPEDDQGFASV